MIARGCYEMAAWLSRLIVAGVILAAAHPAFADGPNFADLLARAKAQAAAGHRWAPSGDNMTETVSAMMALISSATPEQLAELSDLLEGDAKRLPHPAAKSEAVSGPASPAAAAEPDQADEKPDLPPLNSEPDRPVDDPLRRQPGLSWTGLWNTPLGRRQPRSQLGRSNRPAAPVARFELDRPVERPAVSAARSEPAAAPTATSEPDRAVARPVVPATTSEPDRRVPRPGVQAMATEPERAITRPGASSARLPSPRATDLLGRGQQAEQLGDFSGARRFYASAVQLGSATAARDLGRLYDPVFLKRTTLGGIDPDLAQARHWYELAVAMGDPDAAPLLEALASR